MQEITALGLKNEIKKKGKPFTLVDIRDPYMYREKHIPNAVNVFKNKDFLKNFQEIIPDLDAVVVLYDDHEEYNEQVKKRAEELEKNNYTQVCVLKDGFLPWLESGGTVMFGNES